MSICGSKPVYVYLIEVVEPVYNSTFIRTRFLRLSFNERRNLITTLLLAFTRLVLSLCGYHFLICSNYSLLEKFHTPFTYDL